MPIAISFSDTYATLSLALPERVTKRDRGSESLLKLARAFGDPISFALTPREFIMFCPALFAQ
jgi:hypothetical protein